MTQQHNAPCTTVDETETSFADNNHANAKRDTTDTTFVANNSAISQRHETENENNAGKTTESSSTEQQTFTPDLPNIWHQVHRRAFAETTKHVS